MPVNPQAGLFQGSLAIHEMAFAYKVRQQLRLDGKLSLFQVLLFDPFHALLGHDHFSRGKDVIASGAFPLATDRLFCCVPCLQHCHPTRVALRALHQKSN